MRILIVEDKEPMATSFEICCALREKADGRQPEFGTEMDTVDEETGG